MTDILDGQRRSNRQTTEPLIKKPKQANRIGHKNCNLSLKYDRLSSAGKNSGNAAPVALLGSGREYV